LATPQYRPAPIIPEHVFAVRNRAISKCQAPGPGPDRAPTGIMASSEVPYAESGVMERNELLKEISVDPNVCFGKPCNQ